ncbi:hypothetical protein FJT64_005626 [Amphibalanus amphitrite]|uniref:Uncharacterized protein n=1 Tax=Amphibalanus amphitrite TaxID=1232801 RepID=A0A6A4VZ80_AMPAM|nr:hypothetical protein FJT64_005626 [Amphibalanus amphitrite]
MSAGIISARTTEVERGRPQPTQEPPGREDGRAGEEDGREDETRTLPPEPYRSSAPELNQDAASSTHTLSSDSRSLTIVTDESLPETDLSSSSEEATVREETGSGDSSILAAGDDSPAQ